MKKRTFFNIAGLASIALLALSFSQSRAFAQDYDDPPSRVARLGYISGAVSLQPAGTDDWVDATVNRPMTTGDKLWSDRGSRAALHIGSASLNLSENTGFSFLNLTDTAAQLQLTTGTLRIRVKWLGDNENFEVDTPNLAFTILRPGIYKISVNESGDTTIIKDRSGAGEVTGGGSAYTLHAGDAGTFYGTYQLSADVENFGNDDDDFERWCQQRDHHEDISVSARYVSSDAIGYDDLDDNGGWRPVPEYGMVWFPHTAVPGWAPYHYGHWAYIAPWGYTWVDDEPWGFTPFHYGRWVAVGGVWGWIPCPPRPVAPGPVYVRPVYAPALVAWIGGPHFGISVSIGGGGGVGWFPLGPREVYVPSYPVSRTYVNNVNVSNTTVNTTVVNNYYTNVVVNKNVNVTNVTYVNQRVPGAVAATTPQAFSSGQAVSRNAVRFDPREVAVAPVNVITPAAVPQRGAVLGGRGATTAMPPAAIQARVVVAKTTPPPPPIAFVQRQSAIQSNGGQPLSVAQTLQITRSHTQQIAAVPQVKVAPPANPVVPQNQQAAKSGPLTPPNQNVPKGPPPMQTLNTGNKPSGQPVINNNAQRPPTAHPVDQQLEEQHLQQSIELHRLQDQEYQRLQQQQRQAQLLQQQKADAAKAQQLQQQHQQQLQTLEQKHQQQLQQLQQKQEAEHRPAEKPQAPKVPPQPKPKDDRPPK